MLAMPETATSRLATIASETDAYLHERVEARRGVWPDSLVDAIAYALLSGGKRLRPALSVLWCDACGGAPGASMPAAGAIEAIHAFSLVHDDLPAMDDDDLRRGRPTLHIHAGEAMAILAGDALQTLAFDLLTREAPSAEVGLAWSRELSAGTLGMIAGQVLDTMGGHDEGLTDLEKLRQTHEGKTGALIAAACRCGAIAAGADAGTLDRATTYGRSIGLMFQAVDDLLDVEGDSAVVGKRTGKDAEAGKLTYPGLLGVEGTRREISKLLEEAKASTDDATLCDLAVWMASRSH